LISVALCDLAPRRSIDVAAAKGGCRPGQLDSYPGHRRLALTVREPKANAICERGNAATVYLPTNLAFGASGNLIVADYNNNTIRTIVLR
jgi:hypothetical protein